MWPLESIHSGRTTSSCSMTGPLMAPERSGGLRQLPRPINRDVCHSGDRPRFVGDHQSIYFDPFMTFVLVIRRDPSTHVQCIANPGNRVVLNRAAHMHPCRKNDVMR